MSLQTVANPITRQQALLNAQSFMQERGRSFAVSSLRHAPMVSDVSPAPEYYVFNIGDNQGYVIASGDDDVPAVLGYSDKGSVDVDRMPCAMKEWLEEYARQIQFVREHGTSSAYAPNRDNSTISPLLTCFWGQEEPYNDHCPIDQDGKRCVTGCVATAMAQVLYYYRDHTVSATTHPTTAYTTDSHGLNIESIPAGSPIDWDNMIDRYTSSATTAQKTAVADLMKYCGAAVAMDYTSTSSGAYNETSLRALIAYFNYSSKMTMHSRSDYSASNWDNLILNELSNSRPVLYFGNNGRGGHAFVCDGYNGGYFHINWGWGGDEGYYLLTTSGTSAIPYYNKQQAIVGIVPRSEMPDPTSGIQFADNAVRGACLKAADTNDDGVLTTREAAAARDADDFVFYKLPVTSFDEFQYFSRVTSVAEGAFYQCGSLESVVLPKSVTEIKKYAFFDCGKLANFELTSAIQTIGEGAFYACDSLKTLTFPATLTTIDRYAFYKCTGLTGAELGNALTTIGESAFNGCSSLSIVNIPKSVTTIGDYAFKDCVNLTDFTWNAPGCTSEFTVPKSVERLTIGDDVQEIPTSFVRSGKVQRVKLGNSVEVIGNMAFSDCNKLTNITLPNTVTTIGNMAFTNCIGLTNFTLPNSVTTIGMYAFSNCSGLDRMVFPASLTSIGRNAFSNCVGLTRVVIPNSVVSIGEEVFAGCDSLTDFTWNASACESSFTVPSTVKRLVIGNDVEDIPAEFAKGVNLTDLTFGKSVKTIGNSAFSGCPNLTSVIIPASVTSIGMSAFKGLTRLNQVTCRAVVPPAARFNTFSSYQDATLTVPASAVEAYMATSPWNSFGTIVGYNEATGDVNLDGEVNIADVNAVIDQILTGQFLETGDVNGDGEVNIADVNALIDQILAL